MEVVGKISCFLLELNQSCSHQAIFLRGRKKSHEVIVAFLFAEYLRV